jgi:hypothetical protein
MNEIRRPTGAAARKMIGFCGTRCDGRSPAILRKPMRISVDRKAVLWL